MKQIPSLIIDEVSHVLDLWLPTRVRFTDIPGLSIAVAYKGKIVYAKGFGYADMEKKTKTTEKTLYHIASISKTFTSVAILQLAERGKLKLDDKASKYVKSFKIKNKVGDLDDITIKQLLSNSSGVWRDGDTPHWTTGKFPKALKWSEDTLIFKPGEEFKYSNFGFSVLGGVIKSITGSTYEEYVRKNILDVLDLKSTHPDYKKELSNVAAGYGRPITGVKREKFKHFQAHAYMPATGFISNAVDLAKYAYYLSPQSDESLLRNASKSKMMRPVKKTEDKEKYCLGLEVCEVNKRKVYSHGGGFQGFITYMAFDPANGLSVAVLTNGNHTPASGLANGVLQMFYNLLDNKDVYFKRKSVNYGQYEGIYRNLWGDNVIARVGDALVSFGLSTNSPLQRKNKYFLIPMSQDKFILKGGSGFHSNGETASFSKVKNGKAQIVSFGPTSAKRIT